MANEWDLGDLVKCQGTFSDQNGTAHDPTAVYFQVKDPSGNTTSYQYGVDGEVVRSGTGVYYVLVDADEVGWWSYRHYATGTGQAAAETKFLIKESEFD